MSASVLDLHQPTVPPEIASTDAGVEPSHEGFTRGLRDEVYGFLAERGLDPIDGRGMVAKAMTAYGAWISSYGLYLLVGALAGWHAFWLLIPMVASLLWIVLAVMHDGSHGAFARSRRLNRLAALSLGFAGASSVFWHKSHVQAHHGHTNVKGDDNDFETGGLIRLHPANQRLWVHRFQHVYGPLLYTMHSLKWIWWDDWHNVVTNSWKLSPRRRRQALLDTALSKGWHLTIFLVVPALVTGSVSLTIAFYLAHFMLVGLALTSIFLSAHLTGIQSTPSDRSEAKSDWALHQLATTANFATRNRLLTSFVGGLNFQIEHHIFPQMSHTRHRLIHPVVKAYCEARGVTYHEYPTFSSAFAAHLRNLWVLGTGAG